MALEDLSGKDVTLKQPKRKSNGWRGETSSFDKDASSQVASLPRRYGPPRAGRRLTRRNLAERNVSDFVPVGEGRKRQRVKAAETSRKVLSDVEEEEEEVPQLQRRTRVPVRQPVLGPQVVGGAGVEAVNLGEDDAPRGTVLVAANVGVDCSQRDSDVNPLALTLTGAEVNADAEGAGSEGFGYESEGSFIANTVDREMSNIGEDRTVIPDTPSREVNLGGVGDTIVAGAEQEGGQENVGDNVQSVNEGENVAGFVGVTAATEAALAQIEEGLMKSDDVQVENTSVNSGLQRALLAEGPLDQTEAVEVSSGEEQESCFEYLWNKIGLGTEMDELLEAYSMVDSAPFVSLQDFSSDLLHRGMTIIFAHALSDLVKMSMDDLDLSTIDRLCDDFKDLHKTVNVQNTHAKLDVLRSIAVAPFKEKLDDVEAREKEVRESIEALVDRRDVLAPERKKLEEEMERLQASLKKLFEEEGTINGLEASLQVKLRELRG